MLLAGLPCRTARPRVPPRRTDPRRRSRRRLASPFATRTSNGFMPGMTMPFPVKDASCSTAVRPADLVDATLVVQGTDAWISRLTVTGTAPLPDGTLRRRGAGAWRSRRRIALRRSGRRRRLRLRGPARPRRRRDLRLHALPAAGVLSDDRSDGWARCSRPSGRSGARGLRAAGGHASIPQHDTPSRPAKRMRASRARTPRSGGSPGDGRAIDAFGRQFGLAVTARRATRPAASSTTCAR